MQVKVSLKRSLFIFSLVGIGLSSVIVFFLVFNLSAQSYYTKPILSQSLFNDKSTASLEQKVYNLPVRLKIPKIKVDATIESVGLTHN
jgi:hypothetical protein